MTDERWEALVRRLEGLAARDPRGYRVRVAALAGLGYGYVVGILALLTVGVAAVVAIALATSGVLLKFAFPLLVIAFVIVKALWVKLPEPEGYELRRDQAPGLWEQIETVRQPLKAPKVHRLLIDDELNAGVVQTPRFGPLGPQKNHLIVGLPLMQALAPSEFSAVLAHEFGHLSGNHSRFAGWIYRLRRTWTRLLTELEEKRGRGVWLFRRFFEWYAPYFGAYTFALARHDEYVADGAAREAAGERAAAGALVRLDLTSRFLQTRHWPEIFKRVSAEPEPPRTAFRSLRERLPLSGVTDVQEWLSEELERDSGITDTHPALRDRLQGLGFPVEQAQTLVEPPRQTAARAFLGALEGELVEHFDREWHEAVGPGWRERHEEERAARERLEELRREGARTWDERVELAQLTNDFDGPEAAVPLFEPLVAERPQEPVARFWLGRALLALDRDEGLSHLDVAMEHDEDAVLPACQIAFGWLMDKGREAEAERYRERGEGAAGKLDEAEAERADVRPDDPLAPHDLPEDVIAGVRRVVAGDGKVGRAWIARKQLQHFPDRDPIFLVAVQLKRFRFANPQKVVERLVAALEIPARFVVVTTAGEYKRIAKRMREVPGSQIYG